MSASGWIGVDFDGTLVEHRFPKIGPIVWPMFERVKQWLADGVEVRILTARVSEPGYDAEQTKIIQDWCEDNGLPRLAVTCRKDFSMIELWDDRAVQVIPNTGIRADGK